MKKEKQSRPLQVIGTSDVIDIPDFGLENVRVKIDTGAHTSAMHCSRIKLVIENNIQYITFNIPGSGIYGNGKKKYRCSEFIIKNIKSSTGHMESRFVIASTVVIFGRKIKTFFSLTDRSTMKFPILLGSRFLRNKFIVDVSKKNLSYNLKTGL